MVYFMDTEPTICSLEEYLQNPCGTLSIPYWKAKTLAIPDSVRVIHHSNWIGQYSDFQRFFRVKHDLKQLAPIDFDYDTIAIDSQSKQLCEMINASYKHEDIAIREEDVLRWKNHETFREDLCIYINVNDGVMAASGIAEYDEVCREGTIEWVQVLPEYRRRGYGEKIVTVLLHRLKNIGAEFVTASGNLDNACNPLALYRRCGFTGDDVWYVCHSLKTV